MEYYLKNCFKLLLKRNLEFAIMSQKMERLPEMPSRIVKIAIQVKRLNYK